MNTDKRLIPQKPMLIPGCCDCKYDDDVCDTDCLVFKIGTGGTAMYICPACLEKNIRNYDYNDEPYNFCPNCGQALDWSDLDWSV